MSELYCIIFTIFSYFYVRLNMALIRHLINPPASRISGPSYSYFQRNLSAVPQKIFNYLIMCSTTIFFNFSVVVFLRRSNIFIGTVFHYKSGDTLNQLYALESFALDSIIRVSNANFLVDVCCLSSSSNYYINACFARKPHECFIF